MDHPLPTALPGSFDRDTGVKVVLRARPLNALEHTKCGGETCISVDGDAVNVRVAKAEHAGNVRFSFDRVFGPDSTQKQVYDFIGPIAIHGEHCVARQGLLSNSARRFRAPPCSCCVPHARMTAVHHPQPGQNQYCRILYACVLSLQTS